jgi:hypothetical protein
MNLPQSSQHSALLAADRDGGKTVNETVPIIIAFVGGIAIGAALVFLLIATAKPRIPR